MKALAAILLLPFLSPILTATVELVDLIEQPINLGAEADPSRIPLGPVAVESNHGYGIHRFITAPRASPWGALYYEKGIELNMNLASVFGIEVFPEDETQVPLFPVVIVVKDWPVPKYSPYRKDQVVSAVIHCLLRSVHTSPKSPLQIVIEADDPDEARLLEGLAGKYFSARDKKSGGPTPVPGTSLVTDARGVTYVVFAESEPPPARALRRPPPAVIPVVSDGEMAHLIPVWAGSVGSTRPLLARPVTHFYDAFNPGSRTMSADINFITGGKIFERVQYEEHDGHTDFILDARRSPEDTTDQFIYHLGAALHAAVLTTEPTARKPLRALIQITSGQVEKLAVFTGKHGWTLRDPSPRRDDRILQCELVWDPARGRLTSGSIPGGALQKSPSGRWSIIFSPAAMAAK